MFSIKVIDIVLLQYKICAAQIQRKSNSNLRISVDYKYKNVSYAIMNIHNKCYTLHVYSDV